MVALAQVRQDRVNTMFGAMVHMVSAARVISSLGSVSASLLTATGIAVLASAPRWIDHMAMSGAGQRLEAHVRSAAVDLPAFLSAGQTGAITAQEEEESFPQRKLNSEQTNLVQFITKKYSVEWNSAQEYVFQAFQSAREARIDPLLVLAVMSIESSFDADAQSSKGAQGLMQVLTRVHKEKFAPFGGPQSAFDPVANIRVGTQILKHYLSLGGGSFEAALKYYVGAALMNDDQGYGFKVLNERLRLQAASQGKPVPDVLMKRPVSAPATVLQTQVDAPAAQQGDSAPAAPLRVNPIVEMDTSEVSASPPATESR
jgi:soluble lytic murein transglycosylase-like protein